MTEHSAVVIEGGTVAFIGTQVINNTQSGGHAHGSGVSMLDGTATFVNVSFLGNRVSSHAPDQYGAASGAGARIVGGWADFYNCRFVNNKAEAEGKFGSFTSGAALVAGGVRTRVVNSVFAGNVAVGTEITGGTISAGGDFTFANNIVWGNSGAPEFFVLDPAEATVSHSIMAEGYPKGTAILTENPLFVGLPPVGNPSDFGDLHLQPSSPAIDFGNVALLPPDTHDLDGDGDTAEPLPFDLDGNPRVLGSSVDLGPYESPFTVATNPQPEVPAAFHLLGAYPNPFNLATRVAFDLPEAAEVELAVFDVLGRRVAEVGPVPLASGAGQSLVLDGRGLASGLYLYRLTARMGEDTWTATGRVTLLK